MKILMSVLQIDALPVGTRPKTRNRASISEKTPAIRISESELENLRHKSICFLTRLHLWSLLFSSPLPETWGGFCISRA